VLYCFFWDSKREMDEETKVWTEAKNDPQSLNCKSNYARKDRESYLLTFHEQFLRTALFHLNLLEQQ